jgi:Minimal binding motif of Hap4 for binding to Hap2/3/5
MSFSMSPDSAFSPTDATPLAPRPTANDTTQMLSPPSPAAGLSDMSFPEVISNGAFSKTWVLPPRKKPGRKAANDVPPTVLIPGFSGQGITVETTGAK